MMDPDVSPEAIELAKEIIVKLDEARAERDQYVALGRTMQKGPIIAVGPFSTRRQAEKAIPLMAFQEPLGTSPSVWGYVGPLKQMAWLQDTQS